MKKGIILLLALFLLTAQTVYAETIYSDWSTIPTGYPGEEEAVQYGVILPKTWSEWSDVPATDPTDIFFQKKKDFGEKLFFLGGGDYFWDDANAKTLCTWDFGGYVHITNLYIDVDCCRQPQWDNYIQPAMRLYIDDRLVGQVSEQTQISKNWGEPLDEWGRTARLEMQNCSGSGRNKTHIVGTYLQTSLIKYSHVVEWDEPTNWRFDEPYELKGGEEAQKPSERIVYRHPINPKIDVEQRYLYDDSTINDIKDLATAVDYTGEDITDRIVITQIQYDDTGEIVNNPSEFNPSISNTIHVTYYVINDLGVEDIKTVKLYILKDGIQIDLNIYNRYIDKDYLYTLEEKSIWKSNEYSNKLNEAIEWLERK